MSERAKDRSLHLVVRCARDPPRRRVAESLRASTPWFVSCLRNEISFFTRVSLGRLGDKRRRSSECSWNDKMCMKPTDAEKTNMSARASHLGNIRQLLQHLCNRSEKDRRRLTECLGEVRASQRAGVGARCSASCCFCSINLHV